MSYALGSQAQRELVADPETLDRGVARVEVAIRPDQHGDHSLFFRVVLKDDFQLAPTSAKIGRRLEQIAEALRQRAIAAQIPLYSFVDFALESEVAPPRRRRSA